MDPSSRALLLAAGSQNVDTAWNLRYAQFAGSPNNVFNFRNIHFAGDGFDLAFKPDGTKLYVVGAGGSTVANDSVYSYSLSTAWDISTATYDYEYFTVGNEAPSARSLYFKTDGTAMYVGDFSNRTIYQYTLTTAWDVTTASYSSASFTIGGTGLAGLYFKSDGTSFFTVDTGTDRIRRHDMSTAWDVSTASLDSYLSFGTYEAAPTGLFFKDDGTRVYVVGSSGDGIDEWSLSTAWDLSTATYDSFILLNSIDTTPQGISFNSAGTKIYFLAYGASTTRKSNIYELDLSTAWDSSTATYSAPTTGFTSLRYASTPVTISYSADGTKYYEFYGANKTLYEYSLSTAWELSSRTGAPASFTITQDSIPNSHFFKPDGTAFYVAGAGSDRIYKYTLSTAWSISTASYSHYGAVGGNGATNPYDAHVTDNGTKLYVVNSSDNKIYQYSLSTAWDVNTLSFTQAITIPTEVVFRGNIFFNPNGTRYFLVDRSNTSATINGVVSQFDLSTPWDISTASFSYAYTPQGGCQGINAASFSYDGTRMLIADSLGRDQTFAYTIG